MTEAYKTVSKDIESKIFDALVVFLKITQQNITISAGVLCNNKIKFSLVKTEAQVKSITYFLNNNLKINDFKREWNSFKCGNNRS